MRRKRKPEGQAGIWGGYVFLRHQCGGRLSVNCWYTRLFCATIKPLTTRRSISLSAVLAAYYAPKYSRPAPFACRADPPVTHTFARQPNWDWPLLQSCNGGIHSPSWRRRTFPSSASTQAVSGGPGVRALFSRCLYSSNWRDRVGCNLHEIAS